MTKRDLIKALENMDDDVEVVVHGADHGYRRVRNALHAKAERIGHYYYEWFGHDHADAGDNAVCVDVMVIE